MKIFNTENGIEKVYIQISDFSCLTKVDRPIPASIYKKAMEFKGNTYDNRYDFIEYTNQEEIDFFKDFPYIVDYKEVKNKNIKELQALAKIANDEANEISDLWNQLTTEEKKLNINLSNKYMLLHHQIQDYAFVLWNKQRHIKLNMPIEPDSDSKPLFEDDNNIIKSSLEPNILLYYKKDNSIIKDDEIDFNIMNNCIIEQALINQENNDYFKNYSITNSISEDQKYYIIEFNQPEFIEDLTSTPKHYGNSMN